MKLKIGDFILIIAVILSSVALIVFAPKGKGSRAELICDGKVVCVFDLNMSTEYIYSNDYVNKIVVKNGKIGVVEANCHDKVCVHCGFTNRNGDTICCLPNKMIIRVISDSGTDVIAG